jgi:hypothetical protein
VIKELHSPEVYGRILVEIAPRPLVRVVGHVDFVDIITKLVRDKTPEELAILYMDALSPKKRNALVDAELQAIDRELGDL